MPNSKPDPDWVYQCPNCKETYAHWEQLDYPPTHKCKANVERIYTMKLVSHP